MLCACFTCMLSAPTPFPPLSKTKQSSEKKPVAKNQPLPVFFPSGSLRLRTGLQALHLIRIRRLKPLASSQTCGRHVSYQRCQVRGWCQGRGGHLCLQRSRPADAASSLGHSPNDCSPLCPSSPNSPRPAQLCSRSELWLREKAHTPGHCLHLPSKMFLTFPPHTSPSPPPLYTLHKEAGVHLPAE